MFLQHTLSWFNTVQLCYKAAQKKIVSLFSWV